MNQANQLPLFIEPLDFESIERLYTIVDWGVIALHPRLNEMYGLTRVSDKREYYHPISLFKAHALCFLNRIPSDPALERALEEKNNLRYLCGLYGMEPPKRITLYRFRTYEASADAYAEIMRHTLITIAVAAQRINLPLPYVKYSDVQSNDYYEVEFEEFPLLDTGKTVRLFESIGVTDKSQGLGKNLDLPIKIEVYRPKSDPNLKGELISKFIIDLPEWIRDEKPLRGKDMIIGINSGIGDSFVACNMLVLRKKNTVLEEVLLSRRREGTGKGEYCVPGGRVGKNENFFTGAKRELHQEVGISILKSFPVSIRVTNWPGKSTAVSIGIVVIEFKGDIKNKEEEQHSKWDWYPLNQLPEPLFKSTRYVIEDYSANLFPHLSYEALNKMLEDFTPAEEIGNFINKSDQSQIYSDQKITQKELFKLDD